MVELKELKASNPELADAVDMQLALVEIQRRVQARVPLPRLHPDQAWLTAQQRAGRPAVRFGDIPLDWSDFRFALRQHRRKKPIRSRSWTSCTPCLAWRKTGRAARRANAL